MNLPSALLRRPYGRFAETLTEREDHLGSTSLTTDANGVKVSELRYTAWGEVRYQSGSTPTRYTYTGQYSNVVDFGLMFYNARWYDSYLNHFTQPDSIVPDPYNSQSYDRYSYGLNNPSRYTDPTGHYVVEGQGSKRGCSDLNYCKNGKPKSTTQSGGNGCHGLECIHNHRGDIDIDIQVGISADPPNPTLFALVPLAVVFSVTTAVIELAIIYAEGAMAPIDAAMPLVGIPLSLALAASGAAVLDLDIAFVVYTARVAEQPEVHQEFEISPLKLWGLKE